MNVWIAVNMQTPMQPCKLLVQSQICILSIYQYHVSFHLTLRLFMHLEIALYAYITTINYPSSMYLPVLVI